jgi:hypothetical protein
VQKTDGDVQTWLQSQITSNALPFPDDQTVFMIFVPRAASIASGGSVNCGSVGSGGGYGGYHMSTTVPGPGDSGTQNFLYAIVADCLTGVSGVQNQDLFDEATTTISHELAEAATDPDVGIPKYTYLLQSNDAWAPDTRGGEVGDLCENLPTTKEGTWAVQRIWNAAAAKASLAPCQPVANPVYYGAVPHTVVPGQKYGGAPLADGYVVGEKGKTTDVEVDVFSTAPLPGPLTLVASRGRYGGSATFDPYAATAIAKGVTMTFSQPTATNGDKVIMHITVDPTAASVTAKFNLRAVLSKTDYNSWPVILYVPQ